MSEIILITARLSFPTLVVPKASAKGGPPKFSADFIMEPDSTDLKNFMAAVNRVALEKWKEHASAVMTIINADRRLRCYGNGNERTNKKTFKPYDGYENMYYVSALNADQPQAIDAAGSPIDPVNTMAVQAQFKKMYGGCYVSAALNPWPQDNDHGRAIRCKLIALQFLRDGEPFGEAPPDLNGLFKQAPAKDGNEEAPAFPGMPSFLS